jgi:hypothetical protein
LDKVLSIESELYHVSKRLASIERNQKLRTSVQTYHASESKFEVTHEDQNNGELQPKETLEFNDEVDTVHHKRPSEIVKSSSVPDYAPDPLPGPVAVSKVKSVRLSSRIASTVFGIQPPDLRLRVPGSRVVHPASRFHFCVLVVLFFLLVYTVVVMPLELCYYPEDPCAMFPTQPFRWLHTIEETEHALCMP